MSDVVIEIARKAKAAASSIAAARTDQKNEVLKGIAQALTGNAGLIVEKNKLDMSKSKEMGISDSMLDRLMLDEARIAKIAGSISQVIDYNDPVGEVIFGYNLPNGLMLKNIRVPLGVVGIIYEARPNVTVDASVLCLKAGNCVILRGSSTAINSNMVLVDIMRKVLSEHGFS